MEQKHQMPSPENMEQNHRIKFVYDRGKDVDCLLRVGKGGTHSKFPTKAYSRLVEVVGNEPTPESTSKFVDSYLQELGIDVDEYAKLFFEEAKEAFEIFTARAEKVFGVSIDSDVTAYLTVNNRCPYSIKDNFFYVSMQTKNPVSILMHELWHFYTWYKFKDDYELLGNDKYEDMKEALTVLLNVICADLFTDEKKDLGYPQHQEMREKILKLWTEKQDINYVWDGIKNQ